jgi:hypothetical protein
VLIIAVCAALAAAGVVLVVRFGGGSPPPLPLRRYAAVCVAAGLGMLTVALAARLSRAGDPVRVGSRTALYGRMAVAALVLVAFPGFAGAVQEILTT